MDKLEKHIKQSLEQRKLSPSKDAWDKIESQLGNSGSKTRLAAKWYAVAAVFLGAVLAITLFWTSDAPTQQIQVVDIKNDNEQPIIENDSKLAFDNKENNGQEKVEVESVQLAQEITVEETSNEIPNELNEEVAQVANLNDSFSDREQLVIDQKVNEIFAKVALLESNNEAVTDAEVDSLLLGAQNEILADKIFEEDGSVNAMALLDEVEGELFEAERNQLFDKLKESFFKLRTAVADRNK